MSSTGPPADDPDHLTAAQADVVRTAVRDARHRRMTDGGWQLVGSERLPWAYYERPTDRPAEP